MSVEQNKSILRRWIETGWNQRDLSIVDELYTADFVQHEPAKAEGREGIRQYVAAYQTALPDLHFNTDELIGEGDKVVWRFTARGTNQGSLMGLPPTGKQAIVTGIAIFRFANNKIAEVWVNIDALGMMQQIGVIPALSA